MNRVLHRISTMLINGTLTYTTKMGFVGLWFELLTFRVVVVPTTELTPRICVVLGVDVGVGGWT